MIVHGISHRSAQVRLDSQDKKMFCPGPVKLPLKALSSVLTDDVDERSLWKAGEQFPGDVTIMTERRPTEGEISGGKGRHDEGAQA